VSISEFYDAWNHVCHYADTSAP